MTGLLLLLWLVTLGCNLPTVMGLTATPTSAIPATTFTPTTISTPTLTPTPLPSTRLEAADHAVFNGEWDRALAEYQTALSQGMDADQHGAAQLGIGATLVRAGRFLEAIEALDLYISTYPEHEAIGQGFFLRAQAEEKLGRYSEAAEDYQQYLLQRPGLIDAYIQERRGDVLVMAGDYPSALTAYQAALDSPHLQSGLTVEIQIARTYASIGDYNTALARYGEIYDRTSSDMIKAQMDYLMGLAFTELGQIDQAHLRYLEAVESFPLAYDTYLGLIILVEDGANVNQLDRGLVDYFAKQYGVALAAFDRYLSTPPEDHDGTVHYFKGLTLRALGDPQGAIAEWDVLIDTHIGDDLWDQAWEQKAYTLWGYLNQFSQGTETLLGFADAVPDHPRASEFLFDAARITERNGELELAAELWERVAAEYPSSEWAFQSMILAGISRYRDGDNASAVDVFQRGLGFVTESSDRAAAYLWIGKAYQAEGSLESARAAWSLAAEADPVGYYSLRAEELLEGREPFQPIRESDFIGDLELERQEAEEWMRATFTITSPEPLSALDQQLINDLRMVRGEELWQLGLFGEAKEEFESLRQEYENDAEKTYRLMHKFLDLGLYQPTIFASRQIMRLAGMDEASTRYAPIYLKHIRFGLYFKDLVLSEAKSQGFGGLYLMSVIRQESLFESFATSYAAARGLMQIIPSTGQLLVDQLGWPPGYTTNDLYLPVVSVRLGTQYLMEQRTRFDGDLYATLAAYNAGPGYALIWKGLAPDDPDLFLEVIRLSQPQTYIRVIYWAYANYRDLYGD